MRGFHFAMALNGVVWPGITGLKSTSARAVEMNVPSLS